MNIKLPLAKWWMAALIILLAAMPKQLIAQRVKADSGLVLRKVIYGDITPKSVVYAGNNLFFAQNMMYKHSVTVYNREYDLLKTISDEVNLSEFGFNSYKGTHQGAPVEAAVGPKGKYLWVSNYKMYGKGFDNPGTDDCGGSDDPDNSMVYKIDMETLSVAEVIEVGSVPKFLAVSPDGCWVLVSNWCSGDISVIDTENGIESKRVKLGKYPRGIVIDHYSRYAYVAVMSSTKIAAIDLLDFSVSWLNDTGVNPRHICFSPNEDFLYVSLNSRGKVAKISLPFGNVEATVATGRTPRSMVLSEDGHFLYVVNYKANTVSKVRTRDMKVLQTLSTKSKPIGITFDPKTHSIWVACYSGCIQIFEDTCYRLENPLECSPPPPPPVKSTSGKASYRIVLGSFSTKANANALVSKLKKKSISTQLLSTSSGGFRVVTGSYPTFSAAQKGALSLKENHSLDGWVLKH